MSKQDYDTETTGEMHKMVDFTEYETKTIHIASYVCLQLDCHSVSFSKFVLVSEFQSVCFSLLVLDSLI